MAAIYCIDTNIIVILERYMPADVHVGVWQEMSALIAAGRARIPREAYEELTHVDDGCASWALGQAGFVEEADTSQILVASEITQAHPDWVQDRRNAADPWVVAHAKAGGYVIVTDERRKGPGVIDRNLKIPNVADEHGVSCLNLNDLARAEGWTFRSA